MRVTIVIPSSTKKRALPVCPQNATAMAAYAQHEMDQTNPYASFFATKPSSNEPRVEPNTNLPPSRPTDLTCRCFTRTHRSKPTVPAYLPASRPKNRMNQTNPYPSLPSTKPASSEPIIEATTNPRPSLPSD